MSNKIEQILSRKNWTNCEKKKKISRNKTAYTPLLKSDPKKIPIPSLNTLLGKNLRTDTENWTNPTIQPTTIYLKQATGPGHIDRNHFPIGSLNSGINVPKYGQNIDNRTEMKPLGPIMNMIPEFNRANKCDIFNSPIKALALAYRGLLWYGTIKDETGNLVENIRYNFFSKMLSTKIISML